MSGAKGDRGQSGMSGAKGDRGQSGMSGAKGDRGQSGMSGAKGDKGQSGMSGAKGDKGDAGLSALDSCEPISNVRRYTSVATYYVIIILMINCIIIASLYELPHYTPPLCL